MAGIEDSLHLAEKNGDEPGIILAWQRLGQMERELGQWDEAIRFYQRALALSMSRKLHQESQTILAAIGMLPGRNAATTSDPFCHR